MEQSAQQGLPVSYPSSSTSTSVAPSSSTSQVRGAAHNQRQDENQPRQRLSRVFFRVNFSISDLVSATDMRDDVWSCLVVLVTFWFFASMTLILGLYGSANLELGPNCSRVIQANPFFVHSIKAQEINGQKPGPMLYGFHKPPPLDVETTWSEKHKASIQANFHKEWIFFLNEGSKVEISYSVESLSSLPLSLVIARGKESLVEWVDDPSYPNTTLSWNIIHGTGKVEQEILKSSTYYIAVGNLNSEEVEVHLNLTIKAFIYNTSQANSKCSLSHRVCSLNLLLLKANAAVLTSPVPEQGASNDDWYIKLSYGPRWITYFVGSGALTALMLLAFRISNLFQAISDDGTRFQVGETGTERAPLLSPKDDDLSSWGSIDSNSHSEEDLEESIAASLLEGKPQKEGENNSNNPRRLCVVCFDAPRDCFFLPCGHCAACFTCGSRIAEDAGTCPICRRKMKKVRKIFTV